MATKTKPKAEAKKPREEAYPYAQIRLRAPIMAALRPRVQNIDEHGERARALVRLALRGARFMEASVPSMSGSAWADLKGSVTRLNQARALTGDEPAGVLKAYLFNEADGVELRGVIEALRGPELIAAVDLVEQSVVSGVKLPPT